MPAQNPVEDTPDWKMDACLTLILFVEISELVFLIQQLETG